MEEEFQTLLANYTWDLVPCPLRSNVMTSKWALTHKRKGGWLPRSVQGPLGSSGFTQRPGVDYDGAVSPVVKLATVLTLALSHSWPVHQLHVKNAFMRPSLRPSTAIILLALLVLLTSVWKLKKSFYGLKQAPCAWYSRFATYMLLVLLRLNQTHLCSSTDVVVTPCTSYSSMLMITCSLPPLRLSSTESSPLFSMSSP